jgi:hypothetical protein
MENEKMKRAWEGRLAALEARARDALSADPLLTPCSIRQDACSAPPNACLFDDVSPDNRACVVDLQERRACSRGAVVFRNRRHFPKFTSPIEIAGK